MEEKRKKSDMTFGKMLVMSLIIIGFIILDLSVIFYDLPYRLKVDKDTLTECTIVELKYEETGQRHRNIKYYSIMEDEHGNQYQVFRTYKDKIGRKVSIYIIEDHVVRSEFEIRKMTFREALGVLVFPFAIWLEIVTIKLYRKHQSTIN